MIGKLIGGAFTMGLGAYIAFGLFTTEPCERLVRFSAPVQWLGNGFAWISRPWDPKLALLFQYHGVRYQIYATRLLRKQFYSNPFSCPTDQVAL